MDAQLRGPHAELNQLALNEVTLVRWVPIAEQHDLPLVGRQPQSRRADLQFLRARCFPGAGKADDQVDGCGSDARTGRLRVLVCEHAAAPERWQGPGNAKRPPGRKPAARNRGTYLRTVPAPSARTAGTSHGRTSTHAHDS